MLRSLRRSAGLLVALFVGHLTMVAGGAVCTSATMASMNGSPAGQVTEMAGMSTKGGATSEPAPCPNPSQGACVATMPCVNALGAAPAGELALAAEPWSSAVTELIVTMPASAGSAPDLPPPRA